MKVSKYIVLLAGMFGLLACFVPGVRSDTVDTAAQIVHSGDLDRAAELVMAMKISLAAPLISMWFCVLGVMGIGRQRFGRVAGTLAIAAGCALIAVAVQDLAVQDLDLRLTIVVPVMLAMLGAFGGFLALLSPERLVITRFPRPGTWRPSWQSSWRY
jgi:hypothetical protein